MATNTVLTIDMITKETIAVLHDKVLFPGLVARKYDSSYAQTGAKIGDTLRIRKPSRYTTGTAEDLTGAIQNTVEEYVTLPVTNRRNVGLEFGGAERTLSLQDYSTNVLEPAMAQLAADMEYDCVTQTIHGIGNLVVASGGSGQLTFSDIQDGIAKMNAGTTPLGMRSMLCNPFDQASLINELKGLFQSSTEIDRQYKEAQFGRTAGANWYMSNALPTITLPATVAGAANGAVSAGAMAMNVDGLTASVTYPKGSVFTVAGCNAVQPEHKTDLGYLYQFTLVADLNTDGTGAGTATFASVNGGGEALYATGARKNITALPADNATVTFAGSANTTYRQNIMFHENAFAVATVDELPFWGGTKSAREVMDGIAMRVAYGDNVTTNQNICRADVLFGTTVLRPQYACRYWTAV